ncbi:MAG: hypothetical protein ACR2OC_09315 [Solirubrobacterales bacterium]
MSLQPNYDAGEGLSEERRERLPGHEHERRLGRSWRVAEGSFACPSCDLPIGVNGGLELTTGVGCAYCAHEGPARDFLEISGPPRPARVAVIASMP